MKAINIYALVKTYESLHEKYDLFLKHFKLITNSEEEIRDREMLCLKDFLAYIKADPEYYNNFYVSYKIPQIGKEFDLLKYDDKMILNIELKETRNDEKIIKQSFRNHYYLRHSELCLRQYTYIKDEQELLKYNSEQHIMESSTKEELLGDLIKIQNTGLNEINKLFIIREFLISPLNTTTRFLNKEYFLTNEQEDRKRQIVTALSESDGELMCLKASAGTGKTLTLFDIAMDYAKSNKKVCYIHCGTLCEGHAIIHEEIEFLDIYPIKGYTKIDFEVYELIIVDEGQRLHLNQIKNIYQIVRTNKINCLLALDPKQTISKLISTKQHYEHTLRLCNSEFVFQLSGKIRTNKELSSFIYKLINLSSQRKVYPNNNIEILYVKNNEDAITLIKLYSKSGYEYIHPTGSLYVRSVFDSFSFGNTAHGVIGQEFDNVVTYVNNYFFYDENYLSSRKGPYEDYQISKMFYQAISRAREKLTIIVVGHQNLFEKMLSVYN